MTQSISAQGSVSKLVSDLDAPVRYSLSIGEQLLPLNEWLGRRIRLEAMGSIHCSHCGKRTKKSYSQGFCYPCMIKLARCDTCIMSPEKCHYDQGTCREPAWGEQFCMTDHIVYLANSSGLKVGITRASQIPTRWIDQGATDAIVFARVPNRYTAGLVEVAMKEHLTDRTNWQRMLKNEVIDADLVATKASLTGTLDADLRQFVDTDNTVCSINYPVNQYPEKVKSVGFDKQAEIEGCLAGIKGQYLIFDDNRVLNIRKHNGYRITIA